MYVETGIEELKLQRLDDGGAFFGASTLFIVQHVTEPPTTYPLVQYGTVLLCVLPSVVNARPLLLKLMPLWNFGVIGSLSELLGATPPPGIADDMLQIWFNPKRTGFRLYAFSE